MSPALTLWLGLLAACSSTKVDADSCAPATRAEVEAETRADIEAFLADPDNTSCCTVEDCAAVGHNCDAYGVRRDAAEALEELYVPLLYCVGVLCETPPSYLVCDAGECSLAGGSAADTGICG